MNTFWGGSVSVPFDAGQSGKDLKHEVLHVPFFNLVISSNPQLQPEFIYQEHTLDNLPQHFFFQITEAQWKDQNTFSKFLIDFTTRCILAIAMSALSGHLVTWHLSDLWRYHYVKQQQGECTVPRRRLIERVARHFTVGFGQKDFDSLIFQSYMTKWILLWFLYPHLFAICFAELVVHKLSVDWVSGSDRLHPILGLLTVWCLSQFPAGHLSTFAPLPLYASMKSRLCSHDWMNLTRWQGLTWKLFRGFSSVSLKLRAQIKLVLSTPFTVSGTKRSIFT